MIFEIYDFVIVMLNTTQVSNAINNYSLPFFLFLVWANKDKENLKAV